MSSNYSSVNNTTFSESSSKEYPLINVSSFWDSSFIFSVIWKMGSSTCDTPFRYFTCLSFRGSCPTELQCSSPPTSPSISCQNNSFQSGPVSAHIVLHLWNGALVYRQIRYRTASLWTSMGRQLDPVLLGSFKVISHKHQLVMTSIWMNQIYNSFP